MSIISFWSNGKEETSKTLSMAAISTYMAIKHNYRILTVSTRYNDDALESCFWKNSVEPENKIKKYDLASGIEGLAQAIKSNRATPEIITNYTKIIFKDRLEILLPPETTTYIEYEKYLSIYEDLLQTANRYYDLIFVDLNKGIEKNSVAEILNMSDVIVINIAQRLRSVDETIELKKNNAIFKRGNTILLIGRYDKFSKYNKKNLMRYMKTKEEICTVPYCTLFADATNDGEVDEFFLKYRKVSNTDRNFNFIQEIDLATNQIIQKLQEVQRMKK